MGCYSTKQKGRQNQEKYQVRQQNFDSMASSQQDNKQCNYQEYYDPKNDDDLPPPLFAAEDDAKIPKNYSSQLSTQVEYCEQNKQGKSKQEIPQSQDQFKIKLVETLKEYRVESHCYQTFKQKEVQWVVNKKYNRDFYTGYIIKNTITKHGFGTYN